MRLRHNTAESVHSENIASRAEAQTNQNNIKFMTPLRVWDAIKKFANSPALSGTPTAPTAAKTVNNTQIATTAFVHLLAGTANNGGIVDSLLAQNGYIKFANGLIMQWGTTTTSGPTATIVYPVPLNQVLYVSYSPIDAATYVGTGSITSTSMGIYRIWYNDAYPAAGSTTFFVIGI